MLNIMGVLENMWFDGQMKFVNNVGYEDYNFFYFCLIDIWLVVVDVDEQVFLGWLGCMLGE